MDKSYLIDVLRTFTINEWGDINDFITSDYFCKGRLGGDAKRLLSIIEKSLHKASIDSLKKEIIYLKLFPNEELVEGRLDKVMTELNKIVRNYLIIKNYFDETNEAQQLIDLSKILRKRSLQSRYQQTILKIESIQKK
jgi:hypothetical protein